MACVKFFFCLYSSIDSDAKPTKSKDKDSKQQNEKLKKKKMKRTTYFVE
jgi:hypothetical protein